MTRIFIDGFEHGSLDLWGTGSGAACVSTSGLNMDGSYCLELTSMDDYLFLPISDASEIYGSFRWRPINIPALGSEGLNLITFYKGNNAILGLTCNTATGVFKVLTGLYWQDSVLANSSGGLATVNNTCQIEIYVKIADSGGRFVVKVDGVTCIDFTGDTKAGADATFDSIRFGRVPTGYGGGYGYAYIDNVVLDDAAFPGNTSIQAIRPTSAGNSTQWTPSAGSNWDCVDEVPASDADNVVTNENDQVDLYTAENLVGTIGSVVCVQVQARVVKEGAATPQNLAFGVRTGATDYFSPDKIIPTAEKSIVHLWDQNPNTAAAWTPAEVDGIEIGIKSRA